MDDIVQRAMRKWPNVPHCYGWLALDARGNWRMRDESAQHTNSAGDKIVHTALCGFIRRNYESDDTGRWFFQNGPQRVFVNLEATPFIARTDPTFGLMLHTDEPVSSIDAAWLTDTGKLIVQADNRIAQIDDRDLAQCLQWIQDAHHDVEFEFLLQWIDNVNDPTALWLKYRDQRIVINRLTEASMATQFGFMTLPKPA